MRDQRTPKDACGEATSHADVLERALSAWEATISPLPKPATLFKLFTPYRSEKMYGNEKQLDCVVNYDYPLWGRYPILIKIVFFPSIIQCSDRMLPRQAQSSSQLLGISLWCLQILACVASVSNRVTARKLEREQKKKASPSTVLSFFFCSRSNFLDELARKRLLRRLSNIEMFRSWWITGVDNPQWE